MLVISNSSCVRCYFDPNPKGTSGNDLNNVEVFYAKTKDLITKYSDFINYLTNDEQIRAERFRFEEDLETYISCHALLRIVLSKMLNKAPLEIKFINELNNKPVLPGNPVYFNLTHTREAFAFAVSKKQYVGIDLEKISNGFNFTSIIEKYFSQGEGKYILESESDPIEKFFLLWTRKEALLKALGTGIIDDLTEVEVSQKDNFIKKDIFGAFDHYSANSEIFIYSAIVLDNYMSIATPQKSDIILNRITGENLESYLD